MFREDDIRLYDVRIQLHPPQNEARYFVVNRGGAVARNGAVPIAGWNDAEITRVLTAIALSVFPDTGVIVDLSAPQLSRSSRPPLGPSDLQLRAR